MLKRIAMTALTRGACTISFIYQSQCFTMKGFISHVPKIPIISNKVQPEQQDLADILVTSICIWTLKHTEMMMLTTDTCTISLFTKHKVLREWICNYNSHNNDSYLPIPRSLPIWNVSMNPLVEKITPSNWNTKTLEILHEFQKLTISILSALFCT
jgi:hypothetical protein